MITALPKKMILKSRWRISHSKWADENREIEDREPGLGETEENASEL
jgi:hypothetical protein